MTAPLTFVITDEMRYRILAACNNMELWHELQRLPPTQKQEVHNTNHTVNTTEKIAVASDYYLQPMQTCPVGVKVQLENPGGVLCYSTWNGTDTHWQSWAPLPKRSRT